MAPLVLGYLVAVLWYKEFHQINMEVQSWVMQEEDKGKVFEHVILHLPRLVLRQVPYGIHPYVLLLAFIPKQSHGPRKVRLLAPALRGADVAQAP